MAAREKGNGEIATQEMEGTVSQSSPIRRMLLAMAMDATMETERPFTGDDILGILEAETEDEMFEGDQQGPLNFQHLSGCEIAVYDVQVKYGNAGSNDEEIKTMFVDPESGRQMYLMVTAARISNAGEKKLLKLPSIGEQFTANTSARFAVAKLWWLVTHGKIDRDAGLSYELFVQGTDIGSGREVIKLLPVPKRSVQA